MPGITDDDVLRSAVARTRQAAGSVRPDQRAPWLFAQCWLNLDLFELTGDRSALAASVADFGLLAPDLPGRPHLAAKVSMAQLRSGWMQDDQQRIDAAWAMAEAASTDAELPADWACARAALRSLWLMRSLQVGREGGDRSRGRAGRARRPRRGGDGPEPDPDQDANDQDQRHSQRDHQRQPPVAARTRRWRRRID